MSDHSLISPSMLHRMFQCPGSVLASEGILDTASPAAERGTLIHGMAEEMLRIGFTDATDLTAEEHKHLTDYCRYVKELIDPAAHLYVEETVSLEGYVPGMRGTVDALIVGDGQIHCVDLKTGQHPVSSADNPQLLAYALGAVAKYDAWEKDIYVHIWQNGKVDETHVSLLELNRFAKALTEVGEVALKEGASRHPSDDACRYCKAAPECPALYRQQLEVVQGDFADLPDAEKLTDEQIATVVLNRSKVEKWMKQVNTHALDRANRGEPVAGTKVVEGRAVRRWTSEGKAALVDHLGDDAFEQKLIGVTQASAVLGKELVDAMTEKRGSPTLAGLDDKRPALTNAIDDFDEL
jgi:hypothetical protein